MHLFHRDTVIQVAHGFGQDGGRGDISTQVFAGGFDQLLQALCVEQYTLTIDDGMQLRTRRYRGFFVCGALLAAALAVEHISTCHFVVAAAHQTQFDLVLYIFNVEGTAAGA